MRDLTKKIKRVRKDPHLSTKNTEVDLTKEIKIKEDQEAEVQREVENINDCLV